MNIENLEAANPSTDLVKEFIDAPLSELIALADRTRRNHTSNELQLCSIFSAKSGVCNQNCRFCAQSQYHKTHVDVYPLQSRQAIVQAAEQAKSNGAQRFGIVTSGNSLTGSELDVISNAVKEIVTKKNMAVCASLGALTQDQLQQLKDAGVSRYHHNIETSPRYYAQIVSTHDFSQRLDTIAAAKAIGLQVCSGGIIGLGENWEDRITMALILKQLDVDSIPINILVPIPGTPLESLEPISCDDVIRTICIFRIILKDKTIKIAAGRETNLNDFQALGFMAGANGMLIGGYLTIRGRSVAEDLRLAEQIKKMWQTT